MRDLFVGWLGFFACCAVGSFVLQCCAKAPPTPQEAEALYLSQQLACVEQATTLAESRACRAKVRADWGVEGGVP